MNKLKSDNFILFSHRIYRFNKDNQKQILVKQQATQEPNKYFIEFIGLERYICYTERLGFVDAIPNDLLKDYLFNINNDDLNKLKELSKCFIECLEINENIKKKEGPRKSKPRL